jgi:hypothetical protein
MEKYKWSKIYMKMFYMVTQREMKIKTTLRFHLTLGRVATNKKQTMTNTGENVCGERTFIHHW